ncbi:hypothetical protein [Rhodococcus tibetensis]|uniref:PPE family protein n=1 Tax=Rhodococcus tibetensis TaxID=2965064 RepID=A0ABT1QI79_9NOCA|nr:hypothetical protein [Rhodococcus sp. FXJ9.536]MCQ4121999.1 hypothetical protein [Rhodococcus sp. FXJ9.536]
MNDGYDQPSSGENFQSERWDHRAIRGAIEAMSPATSETVAAAWDEIGRRFQDSITAFSDATHSALASGWRGPAAGTAASAIDHYVAGAQLASDGFRDVGAALREAIAGAEAVRGAVGEPVEYATDWTRVMPWNWSSEAESVGAEQAAKSAMGSVYSPAYRTSGEQLPTLSARTPDALDIPLDSASTHAAATGQPTGFDYGPNGIHGIPSDRQVAVETTDTVSRNEQRKGEGLHDEATDAPGQHDVAAAGSTSVATAALAGAVGGGVAQYAHRVVAAHQASAAEPPRKPATTTQADNPEQDPADVPTYLESIDAGSAVIGPLPHVTPAVIGR